MTDLFMQRSAVISPCRRFRYILSRVWDPTLPQLCWVMLNPSTADGSQDDPTVRRCIGFARSWGQGGIVIVNLFAFRATDPIDLKRELLRVTDPAEVIGSDNDDAILNAIDGRMIVAAWGGLGKNLAPHAKRTLEFLLWERDVYCIGRTNGGEPRHPLFVRGDVKAEIFQARKR